MKWEQAATNLAREIARIHGLDRDEVFETFAENYARENFSSDTVTHQMAAMAYINYSRLNPA